MPPLAVGFIVKSDEGIALLHTIFNEMTFVQISDSLYQLLRSRFSPPRFNENDFGIIWQRNRLGSHRLQSILAPFRVEEVLDFFGLRDYFVNLDILDVFNGSCHNHRALMVKLFVVISPPGTKAGREKVSEDYANRNKLQNYNLS
jgi:hypothetical protein